MCRRPSYCEVPAMTQLEEFATPFLLWIFDKSYPKSYPLDRQSIAEYIDYYEIELGRLGMLLRFLGLAEESNYSIFGWMPTDRFTTMRISLKPLLRKHKHRRKVEVSQDDHYFVASIYRIATGDGIEDDTETTEFCFKSMEILGLLKEGENGRFKPTPRLLKRLWERTFEEEEEEEEEKPEEDEDEA
jgi:hypothetical protein